VAGALSHMGPAREVDLKVLDGGISQKSRESLSRLIDRIGTPGRLEFVTVDPSVFDKATLGPGQSHMAYCRILLPRLVDAPLLIYLDCDALIFRDLSELFDLQLSAGKVLAAVRDSETLTLGEDSQTLAGAMKLPPDGGYFNSGVMLLNLSQLRKENFTERSFHFLTAESGHYRFHDQSTINFLLHGRITELPEHWNRPSWRFDRQENNHLDCVLHYTGSAPWQCEIPGPAQVLFERFAAEVGLPVDRRSPAFRKSMRRTYWRNGLAPLRALAFPLVAFFYKIAGRKEKCAAYQKAARYWFDYIREAPRRRRLHHRRAEQIQSMKFKFAAFKSAA
jgi:hypothetical protein